MTWFGGFYRSALGKKYVMAISGIVLFGWIFAHMVGNLKFFLGPEALNHYGEWLKEMGAPILPREVGLWISRITLLVLIWLHIQAATQLTLMNWKARPVGYERKKFVEADYASRTMRWGGVIIALYVVYHILHLTTGDAHQSFIPGDIYHNVVAAFSQPLVSAIYIVSVLALGFHLYHGLWSLFQSLGWNAAKFNPWRRVFATVFSIVVTVGFISVPLAVMLGMYEQ
ncbi:MAG TPA: succinate dehydrogenase cytochrome b subunit [Thermoanaerobaculia bacterium]|nr:succinate dehydrogenase cytochrome b subunit [Thermoanaerobaculia bacterium]